MRTLRTLTVALVTTALMSIGTVAISTPSASAATCSVKNGKRFAPKKALLVNLASARVLALGVQNDGSPRTPPLTASGKRALAWDKLAYRPGDGYGHVLMNAHTYPDGSALGNDMLRKLKLGMIIKVYGGNGQIQCYKVVVKKTAKPSKQLSRYYYGNNRSEPRLALITCSGTRISAGVWSTRTIWFAKPIA